MDVLQTSFINRRKFLLGGISTSLGSCNSSFLRAQSTENHRQKPPLGVHLPLWHQGDMPVDEFWNSVFTQLTAHNIKHCLILFYRFVDPVTGRISKDSQYKNHSAPTLEFLEQGMKIAKEHGIEPSLYPMLEIDNKENIGTVWRGVLNFFGVTLKNFFHQYNNLILQLAAISTKYEAKTLYIGSELASLAHNIAAMPYWEQLIFDVRRTIRQSSHTSTRLTYAAHWEGYLTVPFWRQLDEIGIDAYFPLVDLETARGINHPSLLALEASLKQKLKTLEAFATRLKRPLIISEFGLTPFDQTSARPWRQTPSEISDPNEQLAAYTALFNSLKTQGPWLSGVNLWHWQLPNDTGSTYNISSNGALARLIQDYSSRAHR